MIPKVFTSASGWMLVLLTEIANLRGRAGFVGRNEEMLSSFLVILIFQ